MPHFQIATATSRRPRAAAIATFALLAGPALLGAHSLALPPGAPEAATSAITAATLRGPLAFLAHNLLEGRGPATRGDSLARLYIASAFASMGLEAGSEGAYEQAFDIVGIKAQPPERWTFTAGGQQLGLAWSDEYIAGSGVQADTAVVPDTELVFVGYGIQAPEYQWDDFKGMDLNGKVLLMLNNDPDWDPKLFEGPRRLYYGRWTYKYESAARQGAAGAIIVHTEPSAGYPWQVVQTSWSGEQFELPAESEPRLQIKAWATEEASRKLAALGGHDLAKLIADARQPGFKPVPLGVRTAITLENKISRVQTANVLGLVRGRDPQLKDEVVVVTAHHDHLGIGKPNASGDAIYNGALDNASGVAQILAIAKAFAALPERPRRSVLFAAVAAEEQGLLGSQYYARHPTFPAGRIAANVNFDAGNKWGRTKDITFLGYGKSADLDRIVDAAAALQSRVVKGDQHPDRGYFYRSDQFNFAKIGVPAVYLDGGTDYLTPPPGGQDPLDVYTRQDYHQPSDEFDDSWNFEGLIEDAQVGFYVALAIAERDAMPVWNPGDEFEAARKKALAESK